MDAKTIFLGDKLILDDQMRKRIEVLAKHTGRTVDDGDIPAGAGGLQMFTSPEGLEAELVKEINVPRKVRRMLERASDAALLQELHRRGLV